LGIVTDRAIGRRLALAWGVHPILAPDMRTMTEAVARALKLARDHGFAVSGEHIVVAAGMPFGHTGATNALRVAEIP